jgi:hypothetical protein
MKWTRLMPERSCESSARRSARQSVRLDVRLGPPSRLRRAETPLASVLTSPRDAREWGDSVKNRGGHPQPTTASWIMPIWSIGSATVAGPPSSTAIPDVLRSAQVHRSPLLEGDVYGAHS